MAAKKATRKPKPKPKDPFMPGGPTGRPKPPKKTKQRRGPRML